MTLKDDVNLEGNQYSLLGSIFYLGYLLFQVNPKKKNDPRYQNKF